MCAWDHIIAVGLNALRNDISPTDPSGACLLQGDAHMEKGDLEILPHHHPNPSANVKGSAGPQLVGARSVQAPLHPGAACLGVALVELRLPTALLLAGPSPVKWEQLGRASTALCPLRPLLHEACEPGKTPCAHLTYQAAKTRETSWSLLAAFRSFNVI